MSAKGYVSSKSLLVALLVVALILVIWPTWAYLSLIRYGEPKDTFIKYVALEHNSGQELTGLLAINPKFEQGIVRISANVTNFNPKKPFPRVLRLTAPGRIGQAGLLGSSGLSHPLYTYQEAGMGQSAVFTSIVKAERHLPALTLISDGCVRRSSYSDYELSVNLASWTSVGDPFRAVKITRISMPVPASLELASGSIEVTDSVDLGSVRILGFDIDKVRDVRLTFRNIELERRATGLTTLYLTLGSVGIGLLIGDLYALLKQLKSKTQSD